MHLFQFVDQDFPKLQLSSSFSEYETALLMKCIELHSNYGYTFFLIALINYEMAIGCFGVSVYITA
jgi:hypothetical protein